MKILVVDDHAVLREALRSMLATLLGAELRGVESAEAVPAALESWTPDVVLLDLGLPGQGGLALLPSLAARSLRVLVLSMHMEPIYARRALEAGALGYVSKNASPEELTLAIRSVAAGRRHLEPRIAQELALHRVEAGDRLHRLSERDLEIMRQLAAGRSMSDIAASLGVSYKTIANTATQIRVKLGVARTADLIRLALTMQSATAEAG